MQKGGTLTFVEVKYRRNKSEALSSWGLDQRKRLAKLASAYHSNYPHKDIAITLSTLWAGGHEIHQIGWQDLER
jgi:Holliday junction resolvase-like predicted endonuclease